MTEDTRVLIEIVYSAEIETAKELFDEGKLSSEEVEAVLKFRTQLEETGWPEGLT